MYLKNVLPLFVVGVSLLSLGASDSIVSLLAYFFRSPRSSTSLIVIFSKNKYKNKRSNRVVLLVTWHDDCNIYIQKPNVVPTTYYDS